MAKRPRLLIVEEALHRTNGHYFQYAKDILEGCRACGVEVQFLVHKEAVPEILKSLPAHPAIRYSRWDNIYDSPNPAIRWLNVFRHNYRLYKDVAAYLKTSEPFDLYLAPSNIVHHVFAHHAVWRKFGRRKLGHMTLIFIDAIGAYINDYSALSFSKRTLIIRKGMARFAPDVARGEVTFAAESEKMADHFKQASGIQPITVPHVVHFEESIRQRLSANRPRNPERPTLALFGWTRYDKGNDIFQEAIKRFLQDRPDFGGRFVLQWIQDYDLPDGTRATPEPALQADERVQFPGKFAHDEDYPNWLDQTDIMVLPYRRGFYFARMSRVAVDAAIVGIPVIYPSRTWMADLLDDTGAGTSFEDEDASDLARKMTDAIDNIAKLTTAAQQSAPHMVEAFSGKRFVELVLNDALKG